MTINEQAIRAATQAAQSVLEGQDALHCTRVWEAWGYDTMTAHDFAPVAQDEEAVAEIVNSVMEAALPHIRKQIAEEIRAEVPVMGAQKAGKVYYLALMHAANIVEGES